ncbi:hypothetical protein BGY98DRAFT_1177851, partial [Russula aff. rugulosa BPL654]
MPFSAKPSAAFCLTLFLAAGQRALAVNDWSVPCTQGKCSWDVPADTGTSGSYKFRDSLSGLSVWPDAICARGSTQVLQSNLVTRVNSSETPVHQLTLDTNFAAADTSQGEVNFSVQGQNRPNDSSTVKRRNHRRSQPLARVTIGSFNKSLSEKPAPLNFSGQKNLFSDGSGSIDVDANLQASVGISAVAAGSIIPPKVTQFGITF